MLTPLFLCLYLLFLVIDVVVVWVWMWSEFLVWLGWFHLFLFLVIIWLFRDEFYALAEKHQTRIVFSPRVYWFFSLAWWLVLSAFFFSTYFFNFLSRGILFSLLLFWFWVQLFDFFPVKTRQVQRIVFWSTLLGVWAFCVLAWGPIQQLFTGLTTQLPTDTGSTTPTSWTNEGEDMLPSTTTGIALEEILNMQTWAVTTSGWSEVTGGVVKEEENIVTTTALKTGEPITYRMLLPYLDEKWLLPAVRETPTFTNLSKQDPLYQSFQRAWGLKMIWTNINPDWQVRCENLMVLIGLAKNRSVSASLPVLDAYRQASSQNDMRWSCLTRDQVSTQDMLATIQ